MNIVGLSGSLRPASYNTLLLRAAAEYLPSSGQFQLATLDLPLYNETLEGDALPAAVVQLKQAVAAADGLLIATPEYNHSFSGVLKNAIDWLSRPAFQSPLKGKSIALLSASMSPLGGARAQAQLRPVLASTLAEVYPGIEFLLGSAHNAFSAEGQLSDETARKRLQRFVTEYGQWLRA